MKAAVAILCLSLAACATAPKPPPVPPQISVAVPVTCVPKNLDPAPLYPYSRAQLAAEAEGPKRYLMLFQNFLLMDQRLTEVEPVIAACRDDPPH